MRYLEQQFNELRQKMSAIDVLLNDMTSGLIPAFFDPMSLDVSFNTSEATFLRLISFLYCVGHEGYAKVNFDFLVDKFKARGLDHQVPEGFRKVCHDLRTASQHNMDLKKVRELDIVYACEDWFENVCGSKKPITEDDWKQCANAIINHCQVVFDRFEDVISIVLDPKDELSDVVVSDWSSKLTNFRPHYMYVEIAQRVAANFGFQWLDLTKFCLNYHKTWLAELAEYSNYDFSKMAQSQIERDLMEDIKRKKLPLPFTGDDVMERLSLGPGRKVKEALEKAQELYLQRHYTIDEMMNELKQFVLT